MATLDSTDTERCHHHRQFHGQRHPEIGSGLGCLGLRAGISLSFAGPCPGLGCPGQRRGEATEEERKGMGDVGWGKGKAASLGPLCLPGNLGWWQPGGHLVTPSHDSGPELGWVESRPRPSHLHGSPPYLAWVQAESHRGTAERHRIEAGCASAQEPACALSLSPILGCRALGGGTGCCPPLNPGRRWGLWAKEPGRFPAMFAFAD